MKKLFLMGCFLFLSLFAARPATAQTTFRLVLSSLPEYERQTDFRVYYTYLDTAGRQATVNLFIQKDGGSWRQVVDHDKTTPSGYFQIGGTDLYNGEGKYHFYAHAVVEGEEYNSGTVSTVLDMTAPGQITDFRKERLNANDYKLFWKCPGDSDVARTYIYRSTETSFVADSGSRVQEINCSANESKETIVVGEANKDYYFALRALDWAGNAGEIVTDAPGEVIAGAVLGASSSASKPVLSEKVEILPKEEPTGELTGEPTEGILGGGISSEAGEVQGTATEKKTLWPWIFGGVSLSLLLALGYLYSRRRKKSLLR